MSKSKSIKLSAPKNVAFFKVSTTMEQAIWKHHKWSILSINSVEIKQSYSKYVSYSRFYWLRLTLKISVHPDPDCIQVACCYNVCFKAGCQRKGKVESLKIEIYINKNFTSGKRVHWIDGKIFVHLCSISEKTSRGKFPQTIQKYVLITQDVFTIIMSSLIKLSLIPDPVVIVQVNFSVQYSWKQK